MLLRFRGVIVSGALLLLNACGGGGGSVPPSSSTANAPLTTSSGLLVQVLVPAQSAASVHQRRPQYFSPATQSVVITAVGPSPKTTKTTAYVYVNTADPACTGYAATTCNVNLGLTVSGTYALTFTAYDHTQSTSTGPFVGRPLATNETQLKFVAGTTKSYTVALDGIPAYFTISPNGNGYLRGSRNGLTLYGSSTQQVIVVSLDRDGNPIIGPGAPALKLSASSAALNVVPLGATNPNVFTLKATTGGSPAVVAAGTVSLTASAAQPAASGAGSATTTVPVLIAHSIVAVLTGSKILEFYDGNQSPSLSITVAARYMAMDRVGNIFTDGFSEPSFVSPITEYPVGSTSPTLNFTAYAGLYGSATFTSIAVDPSDAIYIPTQQGFAYGAALDLFYYAPGASVFSQDVPIDSTNAASLGSGNSVAVDAAGTWYVSESSIQGSGGPGTETVGQIFSSDPNEFINTGTTNFPGALAVDGSGTLYAAVGGVINEYPHESMIPATVLTGLAGPAGIAVDAAGEVYVADAGRGGVALFPSGYTKPAQFFAVPGGAEAIAVLPSSAFSI